MGPNPVCEGGLRPGVFLDRDGTINEDRGYVHTPDQFVLFAGVPGAIRCLNEAGFRVVVVTNQSGIGRGLYDEDAMHRLHRHLDSLLALEGARIDGYLFCPHHPLDALPPYRRECDCRKPSPGMLIEGARRFGIDLLRSFMVGDKRADVEAAMRAGCRPILVRTGYGAAEARSIPEEVPVVDDLPAAVGLILQDTGRWTDGNR